MPTCANSQPATRGCQRERLRLDNPVPRLVPPALHRDPEVMNLEALEATLLVGELAAVAAAVAAAVPAAVPAQVLLS